MCVSGDLLFLEEKDQNRQAVLGTTDKLSTTSFAQSYIYNMTQDNSWN